MSSVTPDYRTPDFFNRNRHRQLHSEATIGNGLMRSILAHMSEHQIGRELFSQSNEAGPYLVPTYSGNVVGYLRESPRLTGKVAGIYVAVCIVYGFPVPLVGWLYLQLAFNHFDVKSLSRRLVSCVCPTLENAISDILSTTAHSLSNTSSYASVLISSLGIQVCLSFSLLLLAFDLIHLSHPRLNSQKATAMRKQRTKSPHRFSN